MASSQQRSVRQDDAVIVAAQRTPIGSFLGTLSPVAATDLGAVAISGALNQCDLAGDSIDEVLMGCVLPAGLGQAPARQAALKAGLPQSVGCTTVNKVCGSAMKAVMIGYDLLLSGGADAVIAGGMESMSNAPYLMPKVRSGLRVGHHRLIDHMFFDGLENAEDNALMGCFAERCARQYAFSRERQDAYAIESVQRAVQAIGSGVFSEEIAPVTVSLSGDLVENDEQPFKCKIDKVAKLKPAFDRDNGTVTAANSSSISDGAATVILMTRERAAQLNITPLAKIVGHASHAQAPEDFTTAPIGAIQKLYHKTGWGREQVDLFEINEAFAVVAMAAIKELGLNREQVNVYGGACALGHPIGATGARLIVTLIHSLRRRGLKRGIAALCIGGGEATAMALETV